MEEWLVTGKSNIVKKFDWNEFGLCSKIKSQVVENVKSNLKDIKAVNTIIVNTSYY